MLKKKLTTKELEEAAESINCELATLKAILEVESAGSGFLSDGRPRILFEGHIFYRQLISLGEDVASLSKLCPNIVYPKWTKSFYGSASKEWERLESAKKIRRSAALASTSWGLFQIMGFNYQLAGFTSVEEFVDAMHVSEKEQLFAFIIFIKNKSLTNFLKNKQWEQFAKAYNGTGYKLNRYDGKLSVAYKKHAQENV